MCRSSVKMLKAITGNTTPEKIAVIILKFEKLFYHTVIKVTEVMANRADPDQTAPSGTV